MSFDTVSSCTNPGCFCFPLESITSQTEEEVEEVTLECNRLSSIPFEEFFNSTNTKKLAISKIQYATNQIQEFYKQVNNSLLEKSQNLLLRIEPDVKTHEVARKIITLYVVQKYTNLEDFPENFLTFIFSKNLENLDYIFRNWDAAKELDFSNLDKIEEIRNNYPPEEYALSALKAYYEDKIKESTLYTMFILGNFELFLLTMFENSKFTDSLANRKEAKASIFLVKNQKEREEYLRRTYPENSRKRKIFEEKADTLTQHPLWVYKGELTIDSKNKYGKFLEVFASHEIHTCELLTQAMSKNSLNGNYVIGTSSLSRDSNFIPYLLCPSFEMLQADSENFSFYFIPRMDSSYIRDIIEYLRQPETSYRPLRLTFPCYQSKENQKEDLHGLNVQFFASTFHDMSHYNICKYSTIEDRKLVFEISQKLFFIFKRLLSSVHYWHFHFIPEMSFNFIIRDLPKNYKSTPNNFGLIQRAIKHHQDFFQVGFSYANFKENAKAKNFSENVIENYNQKLLQITKGTI